MGRLPDIAGGVLFQGTGNCELLPRLTEVGDWREGEALKMANYPLAMSTNGMAV